MTGLIVFAVCWTVWAGVMSWQVRQQQELLEVLYAEVFSDELFSDENKDDESNV